MNRLSTKALSQYLAVTKRTIQRRALREGWAYTEQIGLGGVKRMYDFTSLPMAIKQTVISHIIAKHEQQAAAYDPKKHIKPQPITALNVKNSPFIVANKSKGADWLLQHSFAHALDDTELSKDYVKVGLLTLAHLYILNMSIGKIKGLDQFCQHYNAREFALNKAIYPIVSRISRITLLRWEKQQKSNGAIHLSTDNEDKVIFDWDLQKIAQETLLVSPAISAKRLRQYFLAIFADRNIPSERRLSQWLKQHKN